MPNQELFDRVLGFISDHEEQLDMGVWYVDDCGTHACLAGHVVFQEGWGATPLRGICRKGFTLAAIPAVAQDLLGLSDAQACALFKASPLDGEERAPRTAEELSDRWKYVLTTMT